jgi:hypothetical protein
VIILESLCDHPVTRYASRRLCGSEPRRYRKNSPICRRHLPISRWEFYCDANKSPGTETGASWDESYATAIDLVGGLTSGPKPLRWGKGHAGGGHSSPNS